MKVNASYHQERLWFIDQFEAGNLYEAGPVYHNIPLLIRLRSKVDSGLLEKSLRRVLERHGALHTRIVTEGKRTLQDIDDDPALVSSIHLEQLDLGPFRGENPVESAREQAIAWVKQPFCLDRDRLVRAALIGCGKESWLLALGFHHIVVDRYSLGIIIRELFSAYDALLRGEEPGLAPVSAQYADFSQWQRGLTDDQLEPLLFYWKRKLSGKLQPLDLPMDRPRPAVHIFHEGRQEFGIDISLNTKINTFCQQQGAGKFTVLLAGFKLLLHKYAGQNEVVVGTLDHNRQQPGLEQMVGPLANLVVLRSFLETGSGFISFVEDLEKTAAEAETYKGIPFEKLDQQLKPVKDMSRTVFFDVLFQYETGALAGTLDPHPGIEILETNLGYGKYDLNLLLQECGETLRGILVYNRDYYDEAFIGRLAAHYGRVLEQCLDHPHRAVSTVSIVTEAERRVLLDEFSGAGVSAVYPGEKTLQGLFAEQVTLNPDRVALAGPALLGMTPAPADQSQISNRPVPCREVLDNGSGVQLTYRELEDRSNRLASVLRQRGVEADTLVGIRVERSIEMLAGILAILKAGGAYLPLDPDYPEERIGYMLWDSGARVLLTAEDIDIPGKRGAAGIPVIPLTFSGAEQTVSGVSQTPGANVPAASLAYIIYTSGTTGKPKGVMIEHRSVVQLLFNDCFPFDFDNRDKWTLFHSYGFDFSVWEMYGSLLYGGKLLIVPGITAQDTGQFLELLRREAVTVLNQTPSAFYRLIREELKQEKKALVLRYVIFGGEALSPGKLKEWKTRYPRTRLINMFGITETTVHVTFKELTGKEIDLDIGNIGKPLPTLQVYLLDSLRGLAPLGVPGELWVAGAGVARGYLNRPELTLEKFSGDPRERGGRGGGFSNEFPGRRGQILASADNSGPSLNKIYRSGDLVKFSSLGEMIYLGRIDHQVKIRGHRIELGEVEQCVIRHERVSDAVVIDREDRNGFKYLCAYVVVVSSSGATGFSPLDAVSQLKTYLSAKLPHYMVPAHIVPVDCIPLTANGKVDRKALPEPGYTAAQEYEPPADQLEERLAEIWAVVLGLDGQRSALGIHDNFFELGGHSLNATVMTSMVRDVFGVRVPLADVFISPTVRGLADYIRQAEPGGLRLIQAVEKQEHYRTSYAQQRLWIICQLEDESAAYKMPGAFILKGLIEEKLFGRAIGVLCQRHESLRTTFITVHGEPRQKILPPGDDSLEAEDLRPLAPAEKAGQARSLFNRFANQSFNLETGPLFRVKLVRLEEETHLLLTTIHHIVTDGWSQGILFREAIDLYNTFLAGGENPLPPLQYQYKDYSAWHNALVEDNRFSAAEKYWLEKLGDQPKGLELPLDHPRQARQTFNGGTMEFNLDPEKTARFKELALSRDATPFIAYLTLVSVLLFRYTGQEDMILGVAASGRDHPCLQNMTGFLVNTLVSRHPVSPDRGFRQLLETVRQEILDCYQNQDYPFNLLVEKLDLERDLSRSPLFNVMLSQNITGMQDLRSRMTGLSSHPYEEMAGFNMSVFDLVFFINDAGPGMANSIMYNSDLLRHDTVQRMAGNLEVLLESVLQYPDRPVAALDIMTAAEYETVIRGFNDNAWPYPPQTVQELFSRQVEKSPDSIAVVYNEEKITYRLLNERANQLAHFLREECGLRPNDIAAMAFERSLAMIVAILGILKAGAGYLAMDPGYPAERIIHMLKDSCSSLLLVDQPRPHLLKNYHGRILDLEAGGDSIFRGSAADPDVVNGPHDTIYVIYTSGSTGTPNGALLSQGMLVNLLVWQRDKSGIDGSLRCLQFTTTSFCVSFQEIMTTLTCGGQLFLIGEIQRQDIDYLMDFLTRHRIENLYLPFSYLNFLFNESQRFGDFFGHGLKNIITAGEQLKITSGLKRFLEANPQIRLHNHYGSSEMHVVTSYTLDAPTAALMPVPPAGKPIANTKIYILDNRRQPVPIGVWGELCIAGCVEIAGYINNKALTGRKLLAHPVLSAGNNRLYCSGDMGRWLPDGNIELKGRSDSQVKIRGFRVELSEIESRVLALEGVKDCVVEVKTGPADQKILVAYVVTRDIEIPAIKKILAAYLPHYMIPTFMKLDSLPLMPNGKVDRERLPEPGGSKEPVRDVDAQQIERLAAARRFDIPRWQSRDFLYDRAELEKVLAYYTFRHREQFYKDLPAPRVSAVKTGNFTGDGNTPGQEEVNVKPLVTAPRRQIIDFDGLPRPDRSLVDYERYGKRIGLAMVKNTLSLQATRGCPYHCLYCHKIWPKHHVVRSAGNLFQEVELYFRLGFRRFVLVDDIFNLDRENSSEFFRLLLSHGLEVQLFFPNGLRTDLLTREYIDLMVEAGTVSLGLALETASPRLQKLIRKNMDLEKLRENVEYLCDNHPHVLLELFLMHGFPTESEEEAVMTLDFLKGLKWIDFPYLHLLKIYPHSEMAEMARENGIPMQAIAESASLAFHELPRTLPFEKSFTMGLQADFLNNYFLLPERLLATLPLQAKVLTRDELVQKYNSYLPVPIKSIDDLLRFTGIDNQVFIDIPDTPNKNFSGLSGDRETAPGGSTKAAAGVSYKKSPPHAGGGIRLLPDDTFAVPDLNEKLRRHFSLHRADPGALRILLLDLSQFFSDHEEILYDGEEPPLGLLYLLTYLNREFGGRVRGKIAKSRIDFDSFRELKALVEEFDPEIIGIRTLTFYKDFFHQAVAWMRLWGYSGPIIAGGPYATSDYGTVLQDRNVNLVVLSEGEITFAELVEKILENHKQMPGDEILAGIEGIAFVRAAAAPAAAEPVNHAYAYIFNMSNPRVLEILNRGKSRVVFPGEPGPAGIDLLQFYPDPHSPGSGETTVELRIIPDRTLAAAKPCPPEEKQLPRGEIEIKLAEIWARVLGVAPEQIGNEDNFFDSGGHSLKATTLTSLIHKELEVKVPLTQVFKTPTLRELAVYIKESKAESFGLIEPVEDKEYDELSSAQQRMFIRQRLKPGDTSYNNPAVVILEGVLDRGKLEEVFKKMIRRHESLRTSFDVIREKPVQRIHREVEFTMEELFADGKMKIDIYSLVRPFDLAQAPLIRVALIRETPERYILFMDMHHIITDGVSFVVFARELMDLYAGRELSPLRCRYRDFARWQNRLFASAEIKRQEAFWLKQFEGEKPVMQIPTDFPRPSLQCVEGSQVDIEIPSSLAGQVEKMARQNGATVYMVLLSMMNILFAKYSGQEDIILGVATAGRRHADLEQTVGMFVNMLALRNRPRGGLTYLEFLREVRDNTLEAFDHQDYPFEELVRKLDLQGNPGRNALFDVVFKLENIDIPEVTIPGLKLKPAEEYRDTTCKFDMVISANHEPGKIVMNFKYAVRLFKEAFVRNMAGHFLEILEQVSNHPQVKLEELELSIALTAARAKVEESETQFAF